MLAKDEFVLIPLQIGTKMDLITGIETLKGNTKYIKPINEVGEELRIPNEENLYQITIRPRHLDYLGIEWMHRDTRTNKDKKYVCREIIIFKKKCIAIQRVLNDTALITIVTQDKDLYGEIWDIKKDKVDKPVKICNEREIYEINELEKLGVKFNSAIEEVDKQGLVITNGDHYDNYAYEIYDTLRNTQQHLNVEKKKYLEDKQYHWIEKWIDEHPLNNDIEEILEFTSEPLEDSIKEFLYENNKPTDRQTYGYKLFKEGIMENICEYYDVPSTIGWDIWKMLTTEILLEIKKDLDKKWDEF